MRDYLTAVSRLPAPERDAVLARVPRHLVSAVEGAGLMDWLPLEVNLCVTRAVYEVLSPDERHRFFRGLLTTVYGTALFYPFVRTALRTYLAGDPARSTRWIPGGIGLLFQGLGTWTGEVLSPRRSRILVDALPEEVDACWLDSVGHSLCSMFDQVGLDGSVLLEAHDRERGTAAFVMEW